ncbi:hypothetical protein [Xanthomarina sp. GH4-25]|uniref:hypothetical protein n=1 Tax=Xanthomarina sp. GH4-25 TaxID=3349335 RepID=UPI0014026BE9
MKTKTLFSAENTAENVLFGIFVGIAIYVKIQIILFIIDLFHSTDIQASIATLL